MFSIRLINNTKQCSISFLSKIRNEKNYHNVGRLFSSDANHVQQNNNNNNNHHQNQPIIKMQFFTSKDCSLCFPAKRIVERVRSLRKLSEQSIEYVDIYGEGNEKWNELYKHDIPVLHINGKFAFKHKIDQKQLESIIDNILLKTDRA